MVEMNESINNANIYYEGVYVRPDGELDFFSDDIISIQGKSIKEIMDIIKELTDVEGTIEIYKINLKKNEPKIHKIIYVYNELIPFFNN
jgi:hypothetical protein